VSCVDVIGNLLFFSTEKKVFRYVLDGFKTPAKVELEHSVNQLFGNGLDKIYCLNYVHETCCILTKDLKLLKTIDLGLRYTCN
jgi:hypothetical protein